LGKWRDFTPASVKLRAWREISTGMRRRHKANEMWRAARAVLAWLKRQFSLAEIIASAAAMRRNVVIM